ncbi:MAG: hypothetical protein R6U32_06205 [Candidatus Woesearchaeota archaeon]
MQNKRGQMTIFIIVGVVILVIVGLVLYFMSEKEDYGLGEDIDTSSVSLFVEKCAEQTAKDAVVYTGLRGGFPSYHNGAYFAGIQIPHYFQYTMDLSPNITDVEKTLEYYMDNSLKQCTEDFESFVQKGYDIDEGDVNSSVMIGEEKVVFDIDYPVTFTQEGTTETVSDFSAETDARIPLMLDAAKEYMRSQEEAPRLFRIGSLMSIVRDKGLKFEVIETGDKERIVSLVDEDTVINGNPFIWSFALAYDWKTVSNEEVVPTSND